MKKALFIFSLLLLSLGCVREVHLKDYDTPRDGLFIHLSQGLNNPQRVMMALSLADKMAEDHDVLVFLDIEGPEVVMENSPAIDLPNYGSSKKLIQSLLEKNATIIVCPMCLKQMKKTDTDLMAGIQLATKEKFFDFTKGRILPLDY